MAQVRVLVLRTAGINCDQESCYAFELTGAHPDRIHVNRLIEKSDLLDDYQILMIPGGFSYGDDIAAGRILANQLTGHLGEQLRRFVECDKLVLGICNGFQVLVKSGLLPAVDMASEPVHNTVNGVSRQATITHNDCGRFEDRWVYLQPATDKSVFISPHQRIYLPIAHGEGKVCFSENAVLDRVKSSGQVAFRYVDEHGWFGTYPINPNGSVDHIASLTDPTGRVLGMMPHPERFVHPTHHPHWTRRKIEQPDGLTIFQNAVKYFE